jgi:hypothetical protein
MRCHDSKPSQAMTPPCPAAGCWCVPQVLLSATEAAEMILRVDDIVRCAPRQRG